MGLYVYCICPLILCYIIALKFACKERVSNSMYNIACTETCEAVTHFNYETCPYICNYACSVITQSNFATWKRNNT